MPRAGEGGEGAGAPFRHNAKNVMMAIMGDRSDLVFVALMIAVLMLTDSPLLPQDQCPPGYQRVLHVRPSGLHVHYCRRIEDKGDNAPAEVAPTSPRVPSPR
jgi:hypothetical protein